MAVAEIEEEPGMAGGRADDGKRIRQARPAPEPGLEIDRFGQREELAGERQDAVQLDRRRRRVAIGELPPAGEPDAAVHRRDDEAVLQVEHRPGERRIAGRPIVTVIAPHHRERELVAERLQDVRRPRSEGDHGRRRRKLAGAGLDAPVIRRRAGASAHRRWRSCPRRARTVGIGLGDAARAR